MIKLRICNENVYDLVNERVICRDILALYIVDHLRHLALVDHSTFESNV